MRGHFPGQGDEVACPATLVEKRQQALLKTQYAGSCNKAFHAMVENRIACPLNPNCTLLVTRSSVNPSIPLPTPFSESESRQKPYPPFPLPSCPPACPPLRAPVHPNDCPSLLRGKPDQLRRIEIRGRGGGEGGVPGEWGGASFAVSPSLFESESGLDSDSLESRESESGDARRGGARLVRPRAPPPPP